MISIDASIFLGMHCEDRQMSLNCLGLIITNLSKGILISYEEIGRIDSFIWRLPIEKQFIYFEFMDNLMSKGNFARKPYCLGSFYPNKPLPLILAEKNDSQFYSLNSKLLPFENISIPEHFHSELSFENFDSATEKAFLKSKELTFCKHVITFLIYE